MSPQTAKALLTIITLTGIGIGMLGFGWSRVRTDRLLDQGSAATPGRVVDGWVHTGSRGGQWPTLVVEYAPAGHAPITRKFDIDGAGYRTALETRAITVNYLPADPRISRLIRFETLPYQLLIGLGGVILASGLLCLWHFMKTPSEIESAGQR